MKQKDLFRQKIQSALSSPLSIQQSDWDRFVHSILSNLDDGQLDDLWKRGRGTKIEIKLLDIIGFDWDGLHPFIMEGIGHLEKGEFLIQPKLFIRYLQSIGLIKSKRHLNILLFETFSRIWNELNPMDETDVRTMEERIEKWNSKFHRREITKSDRPFVFDETIKYKSLDEEMVEELIED